MHRRRSSDVDRTEATRRFCRDMSRFLSSMEATAEAVKKCRIEWAARHNLQPRERFSNHEAAREVVTLYLRTHDEPLDDFIKTISKIPFIHGELTNEDLTAIYRAGKKAGEGLIRPADLGKLSQEDFIQSVVEKIRAQTRTRDESDVEAERAQLAQLRAEVEADKARLERFRSDLDTVDADTGLDDLVRGLPPKAPDLSETTPVPWWKEIGLVGNPFPSYTGLDDIPVDKYDDVIVQTPFFSKHVKEARNDPSSLLAKTILVSGEFGSGKTTLLQYLSSTLGRQGIIPVSVDFVTFDQAESLIRDLAIRICDSLSGLCVAHFGEDPRRESLITDPIALATQLFQTLQDSDKRAGFLVCVDGLHKGSLEVRPIFTFLQQLQNLQESLSHKGIRVGFLVAGSPLWDRVIEQSPSLSGSFHRRETIPPLDEDSAVQAVVRRINAYCGGSALAPSISTDDLRRSFQILSQRIQRPLTFRDFLKDIGNRLEARAFADAGVSVALHFETIEAVQVLISRSDVGERVRALLSGLGDSAAMRDALREVLITILEKGGASERGALYQRLRPAFFILRKQQLIRQRRAREGGTFEWTLSPDLKSAIADISQRLTLSPKATLQAIFEEASTARRAEAGVVYEAARQAITSLLPAWRDQWPALVKPLEECLRLLDEVDTLTRKAEWRSVSESHFIESVTQLLFAIETVASGGTAKPDMVWTLYKDSWFAPENVSRVFAFSPSEFRLPSNESSFFGALHDHNDVITQLLRELREFLQGEGLCRLSNRCLTHDELAYLHKLRRSFGQFAYWQVVDGIAEITEARIRSNCYVSLRTAWGDGAFDRLPSDVRTNIERLVERGHPRARRGRSVNFLYDVSRSEYIKILFESSLNRCIFGPGFPVADRAKLRDSLELIFSLDDRRAHRDDQSYFRKHATEVATCLGALPSILETFHGISVRLLRDGQVNYLELGHDQLEGKFFAPDGLNPPPKSIRVATQDVASLRWLYLQRCEQAPLVVQDSSSICLSPATEVEVQVLSVRSLLTQGKLELSWNVGSPPVISITAQGRASLSAAQTKGS